MSEAKPPPFARIGCAGARHTRLMPISSRGRRLPSGTVRIAVAATLFLVSGFGLSALGRLRASERPLPILGRVTDFALVDQASAPVSRGTLDGEPWVANFAFTRCPQICPRLSERMRALQALAKGRAESLRLVTFSVDPEHDVAAVLKSYADGFGADRPTWKFLTGSEAQVAAVARSFSVALQGEIDAAKADFGIMHTGHLILVDGRGRIRGYYPSSEDDVEKRILADLERLEIS
jgi:protein SCO1